MGIDITCIVRETILPAHLAELARPIGKHDRAALIGEVGKFAARGTVKAPAHKPAPSQLIVTRGVEPEGSLLQGKLLALAPDEFTPAHKRMVDRTPQRICRPHRSGRLGRAYL